MRYKNGDSETVTQFNYEILNYHLLNLGLKEFIKDQCDFVYQVLPVKTLIEIFKKLQDEVDYIRFVDYKMSTGGPMQVYVDRFNNSFFDWTRDEVVVEEEENIQISSNEESQQVDSLTCDDIPFFHTHEDLQVKPFSMTL